MMVNNEHREERYATPQEQLPLRNVSVKELDMERNRFIIPVSYQRLDVWPVSWKQALIDTILRGDPLFPLEGYCTIDAYGNDLWEINDGHQRLNAILDFRDGKFKTWSVRMKEQAEPNSGPPVEPGKTFDQLSPQAKNFFLNYRLYINCPRQRSLQEKTTRFFRLARHAPLSAAERLHAYSSRAKDAAKSIAEHPFWADCYDGDTKRMQLIQSSFFLLALALESPKIYVDVSGDKYITDLACGKWDERITDQCIEMVHHRLDDIACLYAKIHFTRRSIIIPMYQSIVFLENAGHPIIERDRGKLTAWMLHVVQEASHASAIPNYAQHIQQVLRGIEQEAFWKRHHQTVMNLVLEHAPQQYTQQIPPLVLQKRHF